MLCVWGKIISKLSHQPDFSFSPQTTPILCPFLLLHQNNRWPMLLFLKPGDNSKSCSLYSWMLLTSWPSTHPQDALLALNTMITLSPILDLYILEDFMTTLLLFTLQSPPPTPRRWFWLLPQVSTLYFHSSQIHIEVFWASHFYT